MESSNTDLFDLAREAKLNGYIETLRKTIMWAGVPCSITEKSGRFSVELGNLVTANNVASSITVVNNSVKIENLSFRKAWREDKIDYALNNFIIEEMIFIGKSLRITGFEEYGSRAITIDVDL